MKKTLKGREGFVKSHLCRVRDGEETASVAAKSLGISKRTMERWASMFRKTGDVSFLRHGNTGKPPTNRTDPGIDGKILSIYDREYKGQGFTVTLFWSQLEREHGISVPRIHVWRLFKAKGIPMAGAHKAKDNVAPHPLRARRSRFGEMVQVDACTDRWIPGGEKITLHGAIDDCTNEVVGLYFDRGETQNGYFHMFFLMGRKYGMPKSVYTDNRKGFMNEKGEGRGNLRRDLLELGTKVINTSVPQAKGRIERLWNTLLRRLKPLLWHKGIETMEAANAFLPGFLEEFNGEFRAIRPERVESVFVRMDDEPSLRMALTARFTRKANPGSAFSLNKKWVQLVDDDGTVMPVKPGKVVEFRTDFDDVVYGKLDHAYYRTKVVCDRTEIRQSDGSFSGLRAGYGKKDKAEHRGRPRKMKNQS